jgi:hypothetical protein
MESILISSKQLSGVGVEHDGFDPAIIMYINSVFLDLKQMGVGPAEGFIIEDDTSMWTDFIPDGSPEENILRESTKSYMGNKVRMKFDPPANSVLKDALEQTIKEDAWRIRLEAELIADSKEEIQNG